jgi:nucleoside-diphosphate-sugar epimerase
MKDSSLDPLYEFRKVNVEGTLNLARQAVENGVKRFIFISSIKVNGEFTDSTHKVFQSDDKPNPIDPYGISKFEAEEGLRQLSKETGLEVIIIRPPLVYGPGVKANFLSMMKWVNRGIPLPLGSINNKRSLVALDNLVDLIVTCIHHPKAKNQTFLVSDGEDLSTSDLLKRMASAMNKKLLLIQIPVICLKLCAILIGRKNLSQRLMSSLQVDITKTRDLLGWNPPVSIDQAMLITAQAFLKDR